MIAVVEAFTAAAGGQPAAALRHAHAAHDLADTATTAELLTLLDGYQPGQLAPRYQRELTEHTS